MLKLEEHYGWLEGMTLCPKARFLVEPLHFSSEQIPTQKADMSALFKNHSSGF